MSENYIKKLKKGTFSHIESELYCFKDSLTEIETIKQNIMFTKSNDDENIGGSRSGNISDPTGQLATKLITHKRLNELEEITNAIQKVYTSLSEDHQKLIRIKYWTKPQTLTWDGIAENLHVNRRTAIRWRDTIIIAIAEVLGWR